MATAFHHTGQTYDISFNRSYDAIYRAPLPLSFRQWSELLTFATVNNDGQSGHYIIIALIEDCIGAPL